MSNDISESIPQGVSGSTMRTSSLISFFQRCSGEQARSIVGQAVILLLYTIRVQKEIEQTDGDDALFVCFALYVFIHYDELAKAIVGAQ